MLRPFPIYLHNCCGKCSEANGFIIVLSTEVA